MAGPPNLAPRPVAARPRVVVTGASGAVGRHVTDRLLGAGYDVIGLDRLPSDGVVAFELETDDLAIHCRPDDVIVHLAGTPARFAGEGSAAKQDLLLAERVFDAATSAGVGQLVLASSAMVYGAWPENPMPLTEAAPVRPNPEFRFGQVRAEIEAMGEVWAEDTGQTLTVLRAATILARGRENGLAAMLRDSAALRLKEGDAPSQFVHAEDYAAAVVVVVEGRHGGAFNVAADGWIGASEMEALRGAPPNQLRVPAVVQSAVSDARRRLGGTTHPGLTPYLQHTWVVANDKLRSLGWAPEFSNEEAYVTGNAPSRFDGVTAKRRQELALGAAGAGLAVGAIGLFALIRWLIRR